MNARVGVTLKNRPWVWVAMGVVLLLVGLWVLGANEHAAVAWHEGMAQRGDVRVLGAQASPDAAPSGSRVLVSGVPEVVEPPRDRDFRVQADTPLLARKVAMFQWHEVRVGGDVSYQQDWLDHAVDSSGFDQPEGHANTQPFPFTSQRFEAPQVRLNHFQLAPAIVRALPAALEPVTPDFDQLPANLQASFQVHEGMLTTSANPAYPRLGDLRVHWLARPLQTVTVIAQVDGNELVPGSDNDFEVQIGARSLTDVFPGLPLPPAAVWVWRVLAVLLAWLGAWLVLRRWRAALVAVPVALATGVALLGVLAGIMWIAASLMVAVIAWVIAALASLAGWQGWRRVA